MLDISALRTQFPILHQEVYGKPLVYFDNAATTQKPRQVIDVLMHYYEKQNSNIHRGVHYLSQKATDAYEEARRSVRDFIHAPHAHEVIFTRGTTESINLVASSFGKRFINEGDEVLISEMEHHSNIVPWQLMCEERKATIKVIPITDDGELDMLALPGLISEKTKLLAVAHVSNSLGTINPIKEIVAIAHARQIPVLIDGAQAVAHIPVDVQDIDCDFYCFSGHKMYAPMGIGVLYGKEALLNAMPPYQGGGEMIKNVSFSGTTYNELPFKFEAGTPNVGDVLGLAEAIRFMDQTGIALMAEHEHELLEYATQRILESGDIRIIGTAAKKTGVVSFLINNIHPFDAGTILDKLGIAIRTGHHCTQPLMDRFRIPGTMRASFAVYNTKEEIDAMMEAIARTKKMFGV